MLRQFSKHFNHVILAPFILWEPLQQKGTSIMNTNLNDFFKVSKLNKNNNVTKKLGDNMPIELITRMLNHLVSISEQASIIPFATTMLNPDDIEGVKAYIVYENGSLDIIFYDYDYYDYETGEQYDEVEMVNTFHTNIKDPELPFHSGGKYVIVFEDGDKYKFLTKDTM